MRILKLLKNFIDSPESRFSSLTIRTKGQSRKMAKLMNFSEYDLRQCRTVMSSSSGLIIGKFEMPHYVILKKSFDENAQYVLHRHTIPSFIPLAGLCEEFLVHGGSGLEQFALSLHRHLILLSNRTAIVTRLKTLEGIEEVKADEAVRLVELVTSKWTAKIVLLDKGERCVVVNNNNERLQDVEKAILGTGDTETDLVERIANAL